MRKKEKEIIRLLRETYPDAACELIHETPFQLLVSTVLSAQTTDVQVNKVMPALYEELAEPEDWLDLSVVEIEALIKTIGLYKTKARNIYKLVRELISRFDGNVPSTMEELITLPGVGRKTANVVLANAFRVPTIAVDTHVFRLANRIGITDEKDVEKTEQALMKALDKDVWIDAHHLLIFHGRRCCTARKPNCEECPITGHCKYYRDLTRSAGKKSAGAGITSSAAVKRSATVNKTIKGE